jgi:hypothetical protein
LKIALSAWKLDGSANPPQLGRYTPAKMFSGVKHDKGIVGHPAIIF